MTSLPVPLPTLTIVGAGKVARTLARLWHRAGVFAIHDVLNRSPASAAAAVEFVGAGRVATDLDALREADVILLGTGDAGLAPLAARLAGTAVGRAAPIVFHVSGALSTEDLAPLRAVNAALASCHPLTSFADPAALAVRFAGTPCALEGDGPALELLAPAFAAIGARTFRIRAADKLLYHAGAVFASNYLVALLDMATRAYGGAGIDQAEALMLMGPLVDETITNVFARGTEAALTGPIARGDLALVRSQYGALAARDAGLAHAYRALARATARLAGRDDPLADDGA